jgi:hypothetical protein
MAAAPREAGLVLLEPRLAGPFSHRPGRRLLLTSSLRFVL